MMPGLAALLAPASVSQFLEAYQDQEPLFISRCSDALQPLLALPFLSSLDALLNQWPAAVEAHLPGVRDECSAIQTTALEARKLYDNGMGLLFNEAHTRSPVLTDWLNAIRQDLGLSVQTYGRCLIYAIPDGKGTAPHFDQNVNFVVQVRGTKRWTLAFNESVFNPLTRHTLGQAVDPELESYLEEPMPEEMPAERLHFVLQPGAVLFVPRGCWHATEASGDALSLNFTYSAPTWLDLFLAALRSRLAMDPGWRATADGVADPARRGDAVQTLDGLLSELVADMPGWQAADILSATEGE